MWPPWPQRPRIQTTGPGRATPSLDFYPSQSSVKVINTFKNAKSRNCFSSCIIFLSCTRTCTPPEYRRTQAQSTDNWVPKDKVQPERDPPRWPEVPEQPIQQGVPTRVGTEAAWPSPHTEAVTVTSQNGGCRATGASKSNQAKAIANSKKLKVEPFLAEKSIFGHKLNAIH